MATTILDQDTVKLNHDAYYIEATLGAVNDSVGGDIDAIAYQSVSVHLGASWTGTVQFEVQNAFGIWVAKNLISSGGSEASNSTSSNTVWSGDLGARKFRVRSTAFTTGPVPVAIVYMPESQANLRTLNSAQTITGTTNANMRPVSGSGRLNNTNLAANATYTGGATDRGTDLTAGDTRIRFMVRHLAALTPGHLVLEESLDGTTWIETRRTPVPSDGLYHSFDWPIHLRFWRPKFINGAVAQTAFDLQHQASRGDGSSVDLKNVLSFVLSSTNLAAAASFASPVLDLGANHDWNSIRSFARSDQASANSGFVTQWSDDGTNFYWVGGETVSVPASANNLGLVTKSDVLARYCRILYINGAAAQNSFRLWTTLVSL